MTTKRRKAEKLPLPQSTEEAIDLLAHYARLDAAIEIERAETEATIARHRAACDLRTAALEVELKAAFNRLKPWWAVEGDALTEGKRKSLELGGCVIGHRLTPPRLVFSGASLDDVIGAWWADGNETYIRVKTELHKPAIIESLRDPTETETANALRALGFAAVQKEEFFIDRLPPKAAAVEIVAPLADQVPA